MITDKPQEGLKIRLNVDYSDKNSSKGRWPKNWTSHQLKQLPANDDPTDSEHITAVTQLWCEIFDNEEAWLTTVCVSHVLPSSGLLLKVKVCPPCHHFGCSGWAGSATKMGADFAE